MVKKRTTRHMPSISKHGLMYTTRNPNFEQQNDTTQRNTHILFQHQYRIKQLRRDTFYVCVCECMYCYFMLLSNMFLHDVFHLQSYPDVPCQKKNMEAFYSSVHEYSFFLLVYQCELDRHFYGNTLICFNTIGL